ncbi:YheC/YheD family protein [Pseudogracilibacillus auburnensis]|uniref:YheC/YheD family protein n=1 Tax=Pseudogracilibacillus auburnensis TaxID=1494959 RepID=UPI001A972C30|nr:YheC/YheD family protein [Pseudogracilibacillus auburnensis]MBO1004496.1 YheC/YheD family protein [Pseudogracilibacillus auburnensis]
MPIGRHQVKSKSTVAYVLQCHSETNIYLPITEILSKRTFSNMIQKNKKLYIKPDQGRKSRGIIRVERADSNSYLLRTSNEVNQQEFNHLTPLWSEIRKLTSGRRYIVQQEINSMTKDSRYFDLRCHALRVHGEWIVGGICARVGAAGNIVTTSHIGGTPTPLETLFTQLLDYNEEEQTQVIKRLHDCTLQAVKVVSPIYPRNWEFAVDVGLDKDKQVWIYEVNNEPLIRGNFNLLPDKTLYKRIKFLREIAK